MVDEYPCPACGFLVFDEPSGSYAMCPICGWEDDHVQLQYPTLRGGANGESLYEQQQVSVIEGPLAIQEYNGYQRDPHWHPLRFDECTTPPQAPSTRVDYFHAAAEESPAYYWRMEQENNQ